MRKEDIKRKNAIHCKTEDEYNRIISLFGMDSEYFSYDYYGADTVLYPKTDQFGDINGYCKEEGFIVIDSIEILS